MLVLLVEFTVKPGAENQTREYIRKMQEHSRREPGCRMYLGHQSSTDPRRFCFYEQYDDEEALEAHHAAPYFAEYVINGLNRLIESRTREFFVPIEDS